jgi:hypothetical protein
MGMLVIFVRKYCIMCLFLLRELYITGFLLWRQYWRHFFYGGISPSKIGLSAPSLERGQLRLKARVFLYTSKKSRLLCMGRTYTAISPYVLDYGRATSFSIPKRCGFESGTRKSTRSVARLGDI